MMPSMAEVTFRSDMTVDLIRSMASDEAVTQAAQVSTKGAASLDASKSSGLINFLLKNRHGSPFEHSVFTFYVHAPIFVWREMMRHRIASYNEESGRYKQLEPVFYLPDDKRDLIQTGKAGAYTFEPGTPEESAWVREVHGLVSSVAYETYEKLLNDGIAREVARMTLPLNIYSSAYVTVNARALMNFLSLRTKSERSTFPSFPQREIEMVAEKMEKYFKQQMPATYVAWDTNGRVAP